MARGKHGRRAELRRDEAETATTLAGYQHRVARLTAENKELRQRLAEHERTAARALRQLRAERDEAVAPQVEAMRLAWQGEKDRSQARLGQIAHFLGQLQREQLQLTRAEWRDLLALLGVPVADFFHRYWDNPNREQRRMTASKARQYDDERRQLPGVGVAENAR